MILGWDVRDNFSKTSNELTFQIFVRDRYFASILSVTEEREKLKQDISSTRIFSTSDFLKMGRLVEREERSKRDPREAAR
jgi:hypothetical protein